MEVLQEVREKEFYRQEIIEMIEKMDNGIFIENIYWFTKGMFDKEEK